MKTENFWLGKGETSELVMIITKSWSTVKHYIQLSAGQSALLKSPEE